MPRKKFRSPRPRKPGELRLQPDDVITANEALLLAGKVYDEGRLHRRIRRWWRQVLRALRAPR
jgi:hypothetical protein